MRAVFGIIVTLSLLLLTTYSPHAQGIRAGGFSSRGISGGIRGARARPTGTARQATVSNFRGGFSQVGSSSSFRSNSVGIDRGMANSSIRQIGFGQNIPNVGTSFGSRSNLTRSTLGKSISIPQSQETWASRKNTIAPIDSGLAGHAFGKLSRVRSNSQKDITQTKTGRNFSSSSNIKNISRGLKNPLIIDYKGPVISKKLNSNLRGNLKSGLNTNATSGNSFEEIPTPSAPNRDIVHWVDGNNGVKHFSNDINSIPGDARTITLVDGKKPRMASVSLEGTRNLRNSQSRFRQASFTNPGKTANLVIEKTTDFPGQRRGLATGREHGRRDIHNNKRTKGFHHKKGFVDNHHRGLRHDLFRHSRFFPLDPFIFNNSFFFISPVFPVSSFFFVSDPFIFQPIFASPFFGFQPIFVSAAPIVFVPIFPQFTTFTPFIDPFLLNPFFSPFLFGMDFFFNTVASNGFF